MSVEVTPRRRSTATCGSASPPDAGYDFPFQVTCNIPDNIGGPSAGLMFSLAIYDTLTPGSLTGGADIAGTGTITPAGKVGPIGGIQQKIVGGPRRRRRAVPGARPTTATGPRCTPGDMRLVRATTMPDAARGHRRLGRRPRRRRCPSCTEDDGLMTTDARPRPDPAAAPRRPGPGRGGAGDRGARRPGRLGPAGPALRPGRHRRPRRPGAGAGGGDGIDGPSAAGSFTPIEQESCRPGRPLERLLSDRVAREVVRLRRGRRAAGAAAGAPTGAPRRPRPRRRRSPASTPDRQEVRMVAGATRAGATYCALRLRAHDDDAVGGRAGPTWCRACWSCCRHADRRPGASERREQGLRERRCSTTTDRGWRQPPSGRRAVPGAADHGRHPGRRFLLLTRLRLVLDRAAVVRSVGYARSSPRCCAPGSACSSSSAC